MPLRRQLSRVLLPVTLAVAASLATAAIAFAYPPPATTGTVTSGCTSTAQGGSCQFTFNFVNGQGQGVAGASVAFGVAGVAGCAITPTGTTDANGNVAATFGSCTGCGNATITATSGSAVVTTVVAVVCAATASAPLPNGGTAPPGTNPLAYIGIALALLVLVGGAITLRQTRRTA